MAKIKIAVIFGSKSGEHEVSIVSACSIYQSLSRDKYEVTMIGIDKSGRWVLPSPESVEKNLVNPRAWNLSLETETVEFLPYTKGTSQRWDVFFPVLHGPYGEDGTIQGLFELANVPYVGSGVLGSAVGMDKDISKRLWQQAGLAVVPWKTLRKHEFTEHSAQILQELESQFTYPYFIKPANMGSSVGVHKVKSRDQAQSCIMEAFLYDHKVLVEKTIAARELEVAVLGQHHPRASVVGEIVPHHEFYSYEAKYLDSEGAGLFIPAVNLSAGQTQQLQEMAVHAFTSLECRGLARVDFFMDRDTSKLYLNEINTLPGFTSISMYPKLWAASGLAYAALLDELIFLAIRAHEEKNKLRTSFATVT